MTDFREKIVWITGASSGIGEALAYRFAQAGSRLILSSRREAELKVVAERCSGATEVTVLPIDLSRPELMEDAARRTLASAGHVDVMIHNGGISQRAPASQTPFGIDDLLMRTNYLGPVAITKALLPSMLGRGAGHFIVVTSVLGKFSIPGRSGYCASKHALHGFFDSLRFEIAPKGIAVTIILPGWVRTNVSINAITSDGSPFGKMSPDTDAGMTPKACADAIYSAASRRESEVYIGALKEGAALRLKRFAPRVFDLLVARKYRKEYLF